MANKFKSMQTAEQAYAAQSAARQAVSLLEQADQADARATDVYKELLRRPDGRTTAAEMAQPRRDRAAAKELRQQAARIQAEAAPKKKRGWWS